MDIDKLLPQDPDKGPPLPKDLGIRWPMEIGRMVAGSQSMRFGLRERVARIRRSLPEIPMLP